MGATRGGSRRGGVIGRYFIDYLLTDDERVTRVGDERFVVAIRDSLRPRAWVFRFAVYDSYVTRVAAALNHNNERGELEQ